MSTLPSLAWDFPLPRLHCGIPLGNGTLGMMVWGDQALHLTISRAGFWDHRGATPFRTRTTYASLRRLLEAGDEAGVRAAFANPTTEQGGGARLLQQHGGARLVLVFPGWQPEQGRIEAASGRLRVAFRHADGREAGLHLALAMDDERATCTWDAALGEPHLDLLPAGSFQAEEWRRRGIPAPETWRDGDGRSGGMLQRLPEDAALAIAWRRTADGLALASALGGDPRNGAEERCRRAPADARAWWDAYWASVPRFRLPDPLLQQAVELGLWKQAGLTTPGGVAATLQGPWMEEDRVPPWSNDYHFNINVQMVYGPCLPTNRPEHLAPLWDLLRGWLPELQRNAAAFFGANDALMLPHAVDDRCQVVGSFWTGTIDHACTAWVALMAWEHHRYTGDRRLLEELAWPLLAGAFGGYWAMLEEREGRLSLPVSVSPEYGGSSMKAWGRDASFQLAAAHAVAAALEQAAIRLGRAADPRWARLRRELPPYTGTGGERPRIALWQGQDHDESHRHHSHLAGIWPFRTLDPEDPAHRAVLLASLDHWVWRGAGLWTGWCLPWAAILCARAGSADSAVAWLHWWYSAFTNGGHGTLHNAVEAGTSRFAHPWRPADPGRGREREIMQMDAAMGVLWAVCELLVQERGDTVAVLPAIPEKWAELDFDGIRCPGAFLLGASVRRRRLGEVRVASLAGGTLRLRHGLGGRVLVDGVAREGEVIDLALAAGARVVLRPG